MLRPRIDAHFAMSPEACRIVKKDGKTTRYGHENGTPRAPLRGRGAWFRFEPRNAPRLASASLEIPRRSAPECDLPAADPPGPSPTAVGTVPRTVFEG